MPFLIDGSNLGGALGGAGGARDRAGTLARVLPWARGRRRVTLVFDGPEDPGLATSYGGLRVVFSGSRSADRVILEALARRPRDWRVVTDDRDLARACRERGATVLSTSELLVAGARRADSAGVDSTSMDEGPVDVEEWERYFRGE